MIVSSESALAWIVSAKSRCCGFRSVSSRSPDMPTTPFIGVRISWLMFARNSDLSRADWTAASRAFSSAASVRFFSVMSRTTAQIACAPA